MFKTIDRRVPLSVSMDSHTGATCMRTVRMTARILCSSVTIVPSGRDTFGQHQEND